MGRKSIGWKNLWSLTVLVFLRLKPMHPYELQSVIKITHKDDFLQLKSGSLYNAIKRLHQAGLIDVAETSRAGRRPERTIYRITREGRDETIGWLRELLQKPDPDPVWFYAALSFLPALKPRDVVEQLQKRVEHLAIEIQNFKKVLSTLTPEIGRLNLIEVEYALALREAERRWVTQIIEDLRTAKLNWHPERLRKYASHLFATCIPAGNRDNQLRKAK